MDVHLFEQMHRDGVISSRSLERIKMHRQGSPVSVHWDLRTLLYIGILLITGGLGIFLYKNIDTVGHAILVAITGLIAAACIIYCYRKAAPYSHYEVDAPGIWFDYTLMLGCLFMLTFVGYLQFQYHFFGDRWGMATFIPMLFLFAFAYRFDHRGVLALAITNLGTWMGVALAPTQLMRVVVHTTEDTIINGVILGVLLHAFSWLSVKLKLKGHFAPVYKNFALHVSFVSLFAAMTEFDAGWFLWFLLLVAVAIYYTGQGMARRLLYYVACAALYAYFAAAYAFAMILDKLEVQGDSHIYLLSLYVIASAVAVGYWLMMVNKQFRAYAGIQQEDTE